MFNRISMLTRTLAILLIVSGSPALAGGKSVPLKLRFTGTFLTNVVHVPDPQLPEVTTTSALVDVRARGIPGTAVIQGFGGGSTQPPFAGLCPLDGAFGLVVPVSKNPLVATFLEDHSQLFLNSDPNVQGIVCVDFVTGNQRFRFDMLITGGRGRFAAAGGHAIVEGEAEPVGTNFLAETGTIEGIIHRD